MELKIYSSKEEVARNFSKFFEDFVASRKQVHIALSGGSTPKSVFDQLAENYGDKIDWRKVHFYWGDERCVLPTDSESNYRMTVDHLLSKIVVPKENIHRVKGENEPDYEAHRYSDILDKELSKSLNTPKFDLVVLGMGDDGHTASIFPYNIELWNSDKNCLVAEHPTSGQKRITITGKIINNADVVAFLVTGDTKNKKVSEILNKEGAYKQYPASLVYPKSGNLIWFLDADAAKGINPIRS